MAWFGFRKKGTLGKRDTGKALGRINTALSKYLYKSREEPRERRAEAWSKKREIRAALGGKQGANTDATLRDYMDYTARSALGETKRALEGIKGSIPEGRNPRRIEFEQKMRAVEEMLEKPEGSAWTPEALGALNEYVGFHNKKLFRKDRHRLNVLRAFIEREAEVAERAEKKHEGAKRKEAEVRPGAISAKDAQEAAKKALYKIRADLMAQDVVPMNNIRALGRTINSGELNGISASFLRLHIARLAKENPGNPEIARLREFLMGAEYAHEPARGQRQTGREYAEGLLEKAIRGAGSAHFMRDAVEARGSGIWGQYSKNLVFMRIRELEKSAPKSHELAELKKFVKSNEFRGKKETQQTRGRKGGVFSPISRGIMSFFSAGGGARRLPEEITGALKRRGVEAPANGRITKEARKALRAEYQFMKETLAKNNSAIRALSKQITAETLEAVSEAEAEVAARGYGGGGAKVGVINSGTVGNAYNGKLMRLRNRNEKIENTMRMLKKYM